VPTLQTFYMENIETPICYFHSLALPDNPHLCQGEYSDFFAVSTKLLHFVPMKVGRAFSPPQAVLYHSSSGFVVTAVGKQLLKYDIATGAFLGYFPDFRCVAHHPPRSQ